MIYGYICMCVKFLRNICDKYTNWNRRELLYEYIWFFKLRHECHSWILKLLIVFFFTSLWIYSLQNLIVQSIRLKKLNRNCRHSSFLQEFPRGNVLFFSTFYKLWNTNCILQKVKDKQNKRINNFFPKKNYAYLIIYISHNKVYIIYYLHEEHDDRPQAK